MTLESIKTLREEVNDLGAELGNCQPIVLGMIGEIEREISDRYMELPVDADGVPWTEDDKQFVDRLGKVHDLYAILFDRGVWFLTTLISKEGMASTITRTKADACRHVKPDPIKELLEEFANHGTLTGDGGILFEAGLIEQYADKLREAVSAE